MNYLSWARSVSAAVAVAAVALFPLPRSKGADKNTLADQLRELEGRVLPPEGDLAKQLPRMLGQHARDGIRAANERETRAWREVKTRAEWDRYRDSRIQALRDSLGTFPPPPRDVNVRVVRELEGDGHRIKNVVFESRSGVVVTANLYLPAQALKSAAGILICHSHHAPKEQDELQDMGMTWARAGNVVLVMDQLGHGERRQHPFIDAGSYPKPFRVSRQDYYFRSNVGNQLYLIGESQMGYMVWDLMRGVDVLLAQPGVAQDKIILLGSVAGGGDPAAVTAALDARIAAVAPFNFGGPQPETTYPLPPDAEDAFNYAGSGSWESTRNLRLSARDGFLPWVIVGAAAPRRLIYGHEFSWDRAHDPVWRRLEKIYDLYGARDRLAAAPGRGRIGTTDNDTECTNIGPWHRKLLHPLFQGWFEMPTQAEEFRRRPGKELLCLTPEVVKDLKPSGLAEAAAAVGEERTAAARKNLGGLKPEERRKRLRQTWARLLGDVAPEAEPKVLSQAAVKVDRVAAHRVLLEVEPGTVVPLLLLVPPGKDQAKPPVVIGICQQGKAELLKGRAEMAASLLGTGVAVCLPDARGTGESSSGSRDRRSTTTAIAASELMLGQTLVGLRLRDLRSVMKYLRTRDDLDAKRLGLWGDSLAPFNAAGRDVRVPLDLEQPDQAEPLGGLLALFGALFEDDVKAIYIRGGLAAYSSILKSQFVCVPPDVIVPGALTAGDLCDVAAVLAPRPLRLEAMVDGLNRRVPAVTLTKAYEPARGAYAAAKAEDNLQLSAEPELATKVVEWLREHLQP
jgi:cephalosporin-C deacetylase-like acetyl esterase